MAGSFNVLSFFCRTNVGTIPVGRSGLGSMESWVDLAPQRKATLSLASYNPQEFSGEMYVLLITREEFFFFLFFFKLQTVRNSYDQFNGELSKLRTTAGAASRVEGNALLLSSLESFVVQIQSLILCRIKLIQYYDHVLRQATQPGGPKVFDFEKYDKTLTEVLS